MDAATHKRLMGLFAGEAEESLFTLRELSRRVEADDAAAVVEFKQVAHSLKGAAAALSLSQLVDAIHRIEDLAGERGAPARERINRALEVLGAIVAGLAVHGQLGQSELDVLAALLGSKGAPEAGAAPPPAPGPARPVADVALERLMLPAREVDEALRLASAVARSSSALRDTLVDGEVQAAMLRTCVELGASSDRLEALLFNFRMLPASQALEGLDAEVHELAASLGKTVSLEVQGGEVRADRSTLQFARGLIRHLVRNAVDHGLEATEERVKRGKPAKGRLTVATTMAGTSLEVHVTDDGRGFDAAQIRRRLEEQSDEPARIAALSDSEVLLRFATAGGSTRGQATHVSGRGVGLSSVVSLARSKGGDFKLESEPGRGSTLSFSVPLEVYSAEVLTLRTAGRLFGVPLSAVDRTVRLGEGGVKVQPGPSGPMLPVDEQILHLREVPGTDADVGAARFAVVIKANQRRAALAVDELGETTRVAPQSVPPAVHPDALVTGVALMPGGDQLHVLGPHAVLEALRAPARPAARPRPVPESPKPAATEPAPRRKLRLLLAEDSLATREVLRVLLEQEGYSVRVAGDGAEALDAVRREVPDVVVSDFNMPRCDGPALARALRAAPATARLPIILLSSQADDRSKAIGAASGADAYLIKAQFNASVLRATLRRLGVEE